MLYLPAIVSFSLRAAVSGDRWSPPLSDFSRKKTVTGKKEEVSPSSAFCAQTSSGISRGVPVSQAKLLYRDTFLVNSKPAIVMSYNSAAHSCVFRSFSNRLGRDVARLSRPIVVRIVDDMTPYIPTDIAVILQRPLSCHFAPPSKGPPMMTRGRAHPLTVEEPIITMTTAATMIDSSVTHSFVPRYIFFRFLHIHSFVARTFALCRETGRPMVTEVTVNRMIYVTDVYQPQSRIGFKLIPSPLPHLVLLPLLLRDTTPIEANPNRPYLPLAQTQPPLADLQPAAGLRRPKFPLRRLPLASLLPLLTVRAYSQAAGHFPAIPGLSSSTFLPSRRTPAGSILFLVVPAKPAAAGAPFSGRSRSIPLGRPARMLYLPAIVSFSLRAAVSGDRWSPPLSDFLRKKTVTGKKEEVSPSSAFCAQCGSLVWLLPSLLLTQGEFSHTVVIMFMVARLARVLVVEYPVVCQSAKPNTFLVNSKPAIVMSYNGAAHSCVFRSFSNRLGRDVARLSRPIVVRIVDDMTPYIPTDIAVILQRPLSCHFAPPSKGPPMMTRGRAHPLTVEEPIITMTTAATMIDSRVTHSFVPRYIFFRFLHIHSFVARTFALCRETGRPMVTEVTVNRMIYVTDVYQPQSRIGFKLIPSPLPHLVLLPLLLRDTTPIEANPNRPYLPLAQTQPPLADLQPAAGLRRPKFPLRCLPLASLLPLLTVRAYSQAAGHFPAIPGLSSSTFLPPRRTPAGSILFLVVPAKPAAAGAPFSGRSRSIPLGRPARMLYLPAIVSFSLRAAVSGDRWSPPLSDFLRKKTVTGKKEEVSPSSAFCAQTSSGISRGVPVSQAKLLYRDTFLVNSKPAIVMSYNGAAHSCVFRSFSNRLGRDVARLSRPIVVRIVDDMTPYIPTDIAVILQRPLSCHFAPPSKGPPMMTRGRAHPLTVEEPIITMTTAATMIDSSVTHSFVPRYIFFRFLNIHSFVARTFALCRETGRPMVTEVTVNRMIYVTDVYQPQSRIGFKLIPSPLPHLVLLPLLLRDTTPIEANPNRPYLPLAQTQPPPADLQPAAGLRRPKFPLRRPPLASLLPLLTVRAYSQAEGHFPAIPGLSSSTFLPPRRTPAGSILFLVVPAKPAAAGAPFSGPSRSIPLRRPARMLYLPAIVSFSLRAAVSGDRWSPPLSDFLRKKTVTGKKEEVSPSSAFCAQVATLGADFPLLFLPLATQGRESPSSTPSFVILGCQEEETDRIRLAPSRIASILAVNSGRCDLGVHLGLDGFEKKKKKWRVSPSKACKPNSKQIEVFWSSRIKIQRRKASRRRINSPKGNLSKLSMVSPKGNLDKDMIWVKVKEHRSIDGVELKVIF
ncbi:hypothetical protein LXL04_015795 [Taraxacum kok-saghyz]